MNQFKQAGNMTDRFCALSDLLEADADSRQSALNAFYSQFQKDELVVNKWLSLNARVDSDIIIDELQALMKHPAFDIKNPNKVRALVSGFAGLNHKRFHDRSGSGYQFVTDTILQIDPMNPQVAARLCNVFSRWRKFDSKRQDMMKAQLARIQKTSKLSKDSHEIVSKILG